jgi:signal transduction histidine kinase
MEKNNLLQRYLRLIEIARDLASTLDIDSLLNRIVMVATELSVAETASIMLCDESNQQLYFQTTSNPAHNALLRGKVVPIDGSLAGWVVMHRQPVNVSDASEDQRHYLGIDQAINYQTRSLIGVPLITKSKMIGVLEVVNKREGEFTDEDMEVLTALGAHAAVAIENTRLFQQSDLIADLIHELRTPLASLSAAAFLMQRVEMSTNQRNELAQILSSETQRLNELTSAFLDLARLESGRVVFKMEFFALQPLLEESADVMKGKVIENRINLKIQPPEPMPLIQADREKIKQVLLNLISNSIKYNHPDGHVDISAQCDEQWAILRVADDGIGIPPEALPFLFTKFYRVAGTESMVGGSGLGLSICKRIIESHHGQIKAFSQPGKGSTFTVYLPLHQ